MFGLARGTVALCDHQKAWETEAQNTVLQLKEILGDVVKGIEHVGSTSIRSIKAKPIIDIALAVDCFDDILAMESSLLQKNFYYRPNANIRNELLFAKGNYYSGLGNLQTHFIHVVLTDSTQWKNYIFFRDYLNNHPDAAKAYETLKLSLAKNCTRAQYLEGKHSFITDILKKR